VSCPRRRAAAAADAVEAAAAVGRDDDRTEDTGAYVAIESVSYVGSALTIRTNRFY
jgi:hypothetical protein